MSILKLQPNNGEVAVTVVRRKKSYSWYQIDLCNYTDERITAIIPCWKSPDGVLTSVATGKVITVGDFDEVRNCLVGTAFQYPDGTEIRLTRDWERKKFFFFPERKLEQFYRAFGE